MWRMLNYKEIRCVDKMSVSDINLHSNWNLYCRRVKSSGDVHLAKRSNFQRFVTLVVS